MSSKDKTMTAKELADVIGDHPVDEWTDTSSLSVVHPPYWHEDNPWKNDVIYLTEKEFMEITEMPLDYARIYSQRDYYLLSNGHYYSCGVKFGPDFNDYLSPRVTNQQKAGEIYKEKNK